MKSVYATPMSRFLAFIVDNFIVYFFVSIILSLIPYYNSLSSKFTEMYNSFIYEYENIVINGEIEFLIELLKLSGLMTLLLCAVAIPSIALYFIVLPKVWKNQTVGRMLAGVKVVDLDDKSPSVGKLILRELLGGFCFYWLLGGTGVLIILTIIFTNLKGRSLIDMISKTKLIDIRRVYIVPDADNKPNDDYIDAVFKDINQEESESNSSNDDDEYRII